MPSSLPGDTPGPPGDEQRPDLLRAIGLVIETSVKQWRTCLLISAPYAVLLGITNAITRTSTGIVDPTTLTRSEVFAAILSAMAALGIFILVNVLVLPITLGALSLVGSAAVYDDVVETRGIFSRAFDRALDAIAAFLLTVLLLSAAPVVLGALALAIGLAISPESGFAVLSIAFVGLLVPLLYVTVRLSLAVPVVMREGRNPVEALRRSWELVAGGWWWVFGVAVIVQLVVVVLNVVVSFQSFFGPETVGDFVLGFAFSAVAAAVSVVLFGVASGVVYASRAPEDVLPPEVVASEARIGELPQRPT